MRFFFICGHGGRVRHTLIRLLVQHRSSWAARRAHVEERHSCRSLRRTLGPLSPESFAGARPVPRTAAKRTRVRSSLVATGDSEDHHARRGHGSCARGDARAFSTRVSRAGPLRVQGGARRPGPSAARVAAGGRRAKARALVLPEEHSGPRNPVSVGSRTRDHVSRKARAAPSGPQHRNAGALRASRFTAASATHRLPRRPVQGPRRDASEHQTAHGLPSPALAALLTRQRASRRVTRVHHARQGSRLGGRLAVRAGRAGAVRGAAAPARRRRARPPSRDDSSRRVLLRPGPGVCAGLERLNRCSTIYRRAAVHQCHA